MLERKENQICTIENFIDKYQPIRIQSQFSELLNQVFDESPFAKVLQATEKRMFESLHQALLVDNGVADLLGQMIKINKALGLMEGSDDEISNMSPVLSKSQDKISQDKISLRESYSGNRSLAKLGKGDKAESQV